MERPHAIVWALAFAAGCNLLIGLQAPDLDSSATAGASSVGGTSYISSSAATVGGGGAGSVAASTVGSGGSMVGSGGAGGAGPVCGDGVKNGAEACDQSDVGGLTCATAVAPGWVGTVACSNKCTLDLGGCKPPSTVYNALSSGNWSTFDVATVNASAKGFRGAAFDGKYLYLVPNFNGAHHGIVARLDTQAPFGLASSWSTFDVATVNAGAKGFTGAAFDGRYLYLVPRNNDAPDGIVARFDTQAPFGMVSSWSTFDVATVNPGAKGFLGSAFDGRYLYLVPSYNGASDGVVARYDTQASFGMAASWSTFDVSTVNAGAKGFFGAAFDGRYLYLAPYGNGSGPHGIAARFDTQAPFGMAASWSTFDVSTVNASAKGFIGAAFDGRYLYLVPNGDFTVGGVVARFDTQAPFDAAGSWSTFDVSTVTAGAKGFYGAAFDGKYLYLVPNYDGAFDGVVTRFDTQAPFSLAASWSTFDVATVNPGAKGFYGAVFDGKYLYLVPNYNGAYQGIVARFDAKAPAWLPKGWNASFL